MVNNLTLPDKEKITLRWLHDHVPIAWWIGLLAGSGFIFTAGMTASQWKPIVTIIERLSEFNNDEELSRVNGENLNLQKSVSESLAEIASLRGKLFDSQKQFDILSRHAAETEREIKTWKRSAGETASQRDALRQELDSMMEKNAERETVINEAKKENGLLRAEIDQLKVRLRNTPSSEDKKAENSAIAKNNQYIIAQIKSSLSEMDANHIATFLTNNIPRVRGGIECSDLVEMLTQGNMNFNGAVVARLAPYIRRPFSNDCFARLAGEMNSGQASSAIQALMQSEPKY